MKYKPKLHCSKRNFRTLVTKVSAVILALCLTMACQERVEEAVPEEDQDSSFVLKGTVVMWDDSPVYWGEVMVYKADTSISAWTFRLEVGEEGRVLNPRGKMDKEGHFEIEVNRSFLPESGEIKLAILAGSGESPVVNDKDILVVLVASPGLKILDLDKLVGKIYFR